MCCFKFLVIVGVFYSTNSIHLGNEVETEKRYMVYLLQSQQSPYIYYSYWTCGGSIVHPWYVLTAAACIYNMINVYSIAGIDRFVSLDDIHSNTCAFNTRRKIVKYCAPKDYDIGNYTEDGKWFKMDIILAKVDRPYSYRNDEEFVTFGCPYKPSIIDVNYELDFLQPHLDVVALGWGHTAGFRLEKDYTNWNAHKLRYLTGSLLDKESCRKLLPSKNFIAFHDSYSICFMNEGNVNAQGKFKDTNDYDYDLPEIETVAEKDHGSICQNDHGGPLVAWKGGTEVVIGVASYFLVDENMTCRGPSVFTSTACVNKFLFCKLAQDGARRSKMCKHGVNLKDTDIDWKNITTTEVPPSSSFFTSTSPTKTNSTKL